MEKQHENLLAVLASRRRNNFKSQFKSVVLEGLEIFGYELVSDVWKECKEIWKDYLQSLHSDVEIKDDPDDE